MDLQLLGLVGICVAPLIFLLMVRGGRRGLDDVRNRKERKQIPDSTLSPADRGREKNSAEAPDVPHGTCPRVIV